MRDKPYYSVRTGKHPTGTRLDLNLLRRMFVALFADFERRCYFQQGLGYECVDQGKVPGTAGDDVEAYVLRKLKKDHVWPIHENRDLLSENDVFDLIEFLFDHVSKPIDGQYHSFASCGWHYNTFDQEGGRAEFRPQINEILRDYRDGYELSPNGEILTLPGAELAPLLAAKLPAVDQPENVQGRVAAATLKFRSRNASDADRRDAIRDLADVLEYLRPRLKGVLVSKDEQDLFNIVNNFGIRHHNQQQKVHYDTAVWYSWMFYFFLATIHAAVGLLAKPVGKPA